MINTTRPHDVGVFRLSELSRNQLPCIARFRAMPRDLEEAVCVADLTTGVAPGHSIDGKRRVNLDNVTHRADNKSEGL